METLITGLVIAAAAALAVGAIGSIFLPSLNDPDPTIEELED